MVYFLLPRTAVLLGLSFLGFTNGADVRALTTLVSTSPTPTTCWTLKTPAPTGLYCGREYYYTASNEVEVSDGIENTGDCAQLCGYYAGCKGFAMQYSQCYLVSEPFYKVKKYLEHSHDPLIAVWSQQCWDNAYCPPIYPKSPPPCKSAGPEIVRQGSFEKPLADSPWITNNKNITFTTSQTMAYAGSKYANFTVYAGQRVLLEQQLSGLDVFQWYNFSVEVGPTYDFSAGQCELLFIVDGQQLLDVATDRGLVIRQFEGWQHYTVRFRPPRANPLLQIPLICSYPDDYEYDYVNYLIDAASIRC